MSRLTRGETPLQGRRGCQFNNRRELQMSITAKKQAESICQDKCRSLKINNLTINVKSRFDSEKSLDDILFSIASMRLKEKIA